MICDVYTLTQFKKFCKNRKIPANFENFIVWKDRYSGK